MSWLILVAVLIFMTLGGAAYLLFGFRRFSVIKRLAEKHRLLSWLVCLVPFAAFGWVAVRSPFSAAVVFLHLVLFWIIADLVGVLVRKCTKRERRRYLEGAAAILLAVVYLTVGWYNAHNVRRTAYTVQTDKAIGDSLRIVGISDAHLGVTLDGERFAGEMARIQGEDPDAVVVVGDFVDDDSCRADMVRACEALGGLKTTYGVYYVPGNHDRGYSSGQRDFDYSDLRRELEKNSVVILEDDAAELGEGLVLFGRKDRSDPGRAEMTAAAKALDPARFQVVLDHQPNDYANEAAAGADLVISGHTHGGHIWPAGLIGLLLGANDRVYGTETRDGTVFIVTSGISGWGIPFKTGTFSEYVVIDVTN